MEVDERRTPEDELGPVLAAGRDATVHALGDDRVLRRMPSAERDLRTEAEVMEHVRAQGYPVPQVFRVGPGEMVLERIEGPTMLEAIEAHVWQVDRHARALADLHTRLHGLAPPADLTPHAEAALAGDAIVHQDLHPGNVLLSPAGPVVIDWTNARRANPDADVALTWLLMAAFDHDQDPPTGSLPHRVVSHIERAAEPRLRARLVRTFLRASGRLDQARGVLPAVAAHRLHDPNVRAGEADAIHALVARETGALLDADEGGPAEVP